MVLMRTVFQAQMGKADDLVAAFKSSFEMLPPDMAEAIQPRILTDISGPTDNVVLETTHESLAALEQFRHMIFSRMRESDTPSNTEQFVVSARNEYYTIEM